MMEDLKKKLVAQLPDEIEDSNMYFEMAQMAANDCHNQNLAHNLFEISKDEYTHAKFIHDFMVMNGMCLPDDLKCKWMTLEARAHKVYPDVPHRTLDV